MVVNTRSAEMKPRDDERTLWLLVGAAGALAVVIGEFLPLWDSGSVSFGRIQGNSALQSGSGWVSLAVSVIALILIIRALYAGARTMAPLVNGLIILGYAIYNGTSKDARTLCPASATSVSDPACQVAQPGLGVYAMAVGGIALITAGVFILRVPRAAQLQTTETTENTETTDTTVNRSPR
jgi:fumarate reductase subunit D